MVTVLSTHAIQNRLYYIVKTDGMVPSQAYALCTAKLVGGREGYEERLAFPTLEEAEEHVNRLKVEALLDM